MYGDGGWTAASNRQDTTAEEEEHHRPLDVEEEVEAEVDNRSRNVLRG